MMNMGQQVSTTDRLSGLPDDVILHILTFLPTKISVRTSVLSKPWRFRWAHVPSLEFTAVDSKMINVMLRHKQNITTFHLSHEPGTKNMLLSTDDFDLEACIASVFARKVRRLHINLNLPLPRCMFTSETLVDLCVLDCSGEVLDCVVRFPSLKKLQLGNVNGDEALPRLLSGCPVLEELIIERMMTTMHGMCCHDVSSSTLTRLVLRLDQEEVALKLDTPALRYLKLRVLGSKNISATALDSLIEAKLNFDGYNTKPGDSFYLRCVTQFLRKLYNVSSLTLLTRRMEVPDSVFSSVSPIKFRNLIKLKLCADWRFISSFLENANNLQVVTFIRTVYHDTQYWMEPKRVPLEWIPKSKLKISRDSHYLQEPLLLAFLV